MTRLVVTSDAEADFNDIIDYLSSEAGSAVAADYVRNFRVSLARLIDFPRLGAPRPALGANARGSSSCLPMS